ncbi:MAG: hypothetical protein MI864_18815, partial [Pseudomonadales bacterium]|nr:hypothetical protein [Pseudomonadales bacterium]
MAYNKPVLEHEAFQKLNALEICSLRYVLPKPLLVKIPTERTNHAPEFYQPETGPVMGYRIIE